MFLNALACRATNRSVRVAGSIPVALVAFFVLRAGNTFAADPPEFAVLKAAGGNVSKNKEGGTGIAFGEFQLDEKGWEALESSPNLKTVRIGLAKKFGDAQLARLCEIKTIESIILNAFGGTDAGLSALAKLPNLRHFGADHSPITGVGLAALKDSKKFASLRMGGCPFNDEGMKSLGMLTQLKEANLGHVIYTSAGFPQFAKLVNLEKLHIGPFYFPYFVAADFVHLSRLKNLQTLVIYEMALPYDNGLDHLKGLNLEVLNLRDCRVSDGDLQKLKAALPHTKIERIFSIDEAFQRWDRELERRQKLKMQ